MSATGDSGPDPIKHPIDQLLLDEISKVVSEAKVTGRLLRVGYHAGMLAFAFPGTRFSISHIAEELRTRAQNAGVLLET